MRAASVPQCLSLVVFSVDSPFFALQSSSSHLYPSRTHTCTPQLRFTAVIRESQGSETNVVLIDNDVYDNTRVSNKILR